MAVRIDTDLLIPGRGQPIRPGTVVFDGTVIVYAGPPENAPPAEASLTAPTVMPGMWDCHAHLFGFPAGRIGIGETLPLMPPQLGVLRAARHLEKALDAGFTSIREVGGYGTFLAAAVEEGTVAGPNVYAAGSPLSQTGGHADIHMLPEGDAARIFERHFGASALCDGPDDCRRAVRRQLRLGARVIKVCASGGVMSQVDHPVHQQFTAEELAAIVDEAARADRVVAAHCHGKPGIMAAIRAGVKTIEHGTYLDDEAAEAMVEAGAILVPTRFIVEHLRSLGDSPRFPDYARRKLHAIADRHLEALRIAIDHGVRIALGTDVWNNDVWGRNAEELLHLTEAGLDPLAAIEAATATGPETLGPQAPRTGILAPGYDADLITVDGDPTKDLAVLTDPNRITGVWKGGVRRK
jgi:imidazolonepropionase-like amidohydrolase